MKNTVVASRIRMKCALAIAISALGLAWAGTAAQKQDPGNETVLVMETLEGRYRMVAKNAGVYDIFEAINRETGLELELDEGLEDRLMTFEMVSPNIADIVRHVADNFSLAYVQEDDEIRLISAKISSPAEEEPEISADEVALAKLEEAVDERTDPAPARPQAHAVAMGPEKAPSEYGMLSNSQRPLAALQRKDGPPAILMANAVLDTEVLLNEGRGLDIPARFRASESTERYIVQFDRRVDRVARDAIAAAGGAVSHYLPRNAFAVQVSPGELDQVKAISGVLHVEPYHPYFKMSDDIVKYLGGIPNQRATQNAEVGSYNLMAFRGGDPTDELAALGVETLNARSAGDRPVVTVQAEPSQLQDLIRIDDVSWVEPNLPMHPMNDLGEEHTRATTVKQIYTDLDGSGIIVAVTDSGADVTHRGYSVDPSLPTDYPNQNTRIVHYELGTNLASTSDFEIGDDNGHGTHTSGSVLGNGALSDTAVSVPGSGDAPYDPFQFAGMAPKAKLVMIEDFNSVSFSNQVEVAWDNGARLSNNSWGANFFQYNIFSAEWDALVRDTKPDLFGNQELITFFSAGNEGGGGNEGLGGTAGTIGSPGNAKNVITVGAIEQPRLANNQNIVAVNDTDWQIANFSSRGPVSGADPRMKPDIAAPGVYVNSMQSKDTDPDNFLDPFEFKWDLRNGNVDTGTNYAFASGTSMASPIATGLGALVYQHLMEEMGKAPSPAMMKAMMVNGARSLDPWTYNWPPFLQIPGIVYEGWGEVDLIHTLEGADIQETDRLFLLDQDDTTPLKTDDVYSFPITVLDGEGGIKITLAWTDVPGTPGAGIQLRNDLDLILRASDRTGYRGNLFGALTGSYSFPLDEDVDNFLSDGWNNVEVIQVPDLKPGAYTIEVEGANVVDGPQDFALVISTGNGITARWAGNTLDMDLDDDSNPVMAISAGDAAGTAQIFVKRWLGNVRADDGTLGVWTEMTGQWFGMDTSSTDTGVSQTPGNSLRPSVAVGGIFDDIFVAWEEESNIIESNVADAVYLKSYNGLEWIELGDSARGLGIGGREDADAENPQVAVLSSGKPVVAWRQHDGIGTNATSSQIFLRRWNGVAWGDLGGSGVAGIPGSVDSSRPDIAVDSKDRIIVAWQEVSDRRVKVRRWNGSTWEVFASIGSSPAAQQPSVAIGPNDEVYVAYQQVPGLPGQYTQTFVVRNNAYQWQGIFGSDAYPGISSSTSSNMTPIVPTIDVGESGRVMVAWQETVFTNNAIIVRGTTATGWQGVAGAGAFPGIAELEGHSSAPVLKVDDFDVPVVSYFNDATGPQWALTYTLTSDRVMPEFSGLATAVGGGNNNVVLTWPPAFDTSTPITYTIYRGASSFACGTNPDCSEADVFSNPIATTTLTSFNVTGLLDERVYCFGVRATDSTGLQDDNVVIRSAGPVAGSGDIDGDCLDNLQEVDAGTEVCIPDTDGDGMTDGWEWTFSIMNPAHANATAMDPLDNGVDHVGTVEPNDGDPMQDPDEDLDGDGASNFEEFFWWTEFANSACGNIAATSPDPTSSDTDGDGLPDGWEIFNNLDPTDPTDAHEDKDGDGLDNTEEFEQGGDPDNKDSDGDGIDDGDEVDLGTAVDRGDTDRDGLDDGFEYNVLETDPIHWDSNGNSVSDGDDYQVGHADPAADFTSLNIFGQWDFDSELTREGWTHLAPNPAAPFDLWHVSTADPDPVQSGDGVQELYERTMDTAFRLADDVSGANTNATYNYLNANLLILSDLVSPAISPTNASNLFVSWNEFVHTEPGQDYTRVFAIADGDINAVPVSVLTSGVGSNWVHRVADMSDYAGRENVRVIFRFQTSNVGNQNFHGWYVDDVKIYEGTTIFGWVRDENGRPVDSAQVMAMGRGGVTNVLNGHQLVAPGKIFDKVDTNEDGSYTIAGLPQGEYYLKADSPLHKAEFWNGVLVDGDYGFGAHLNPGVLQREAVTTVVDLTATGAFHEVNFEIGQGASRACLGVGADQVYTVRLNGRNEQIWNGLAHPSLADLVDYRTDPDNDFANLNPDWLDNPVKPNLLCDLNGGLHSPTIEGTGVRYPLPIVKVREAETTVIVIGTDQAAGRLFVKASNGGSYPIHVDGKNTGRTTPASLAVKAGVHTVQLFPTSGPTWVGQKTVTVPIGNRARAIFTDDDLFGGTGDLTVDAVNLFGQVITGATVYVDGVLIAMDDVLPDTTNTTPTTVVGLQQGEHTVRVELPGYRTPALRVVHISSNANVIASFPLFHADRDYDRVGDGTEIAGYEDPFRFHRDDDPDFDGLTNLQEFDLFTLFAITLNIFSNDTDGDLMLDGEEVGYDGVNYLAVSTLYTNAQEETPVVYSLFSGAYLDGIDFFENGHYVAAIDCDRFDAGSLGRNAPGVPTAEKATSIFSGIPNVDETQRVTPSHSDQETILSDTQPQLVDTDDDGMWDGYENLYRFDYTNSLTAVSTTLDPIECGGGELDSDGDGLSNFDEFMGIDGIANTNDFLDPTDWDTDQDQMPDGYEFFAGLDPLDPMDAIEDADDDGLTNLGEYYFGSDPNSEDSDNDFLPDYGELLYGSDPNLDDTDSDGLRDGREVWDKDEDGIRDGGFFNVGFGSDYDNDGLPDGPSDWDSDGDGMPDGFEVIDPSFGIPYDILYPDLDPDCLLNPLNAADAHLDCDGDDLSNLEEFLVRDALFGTPPADFYENLDINVIYVSGFDPNETTWHLSSDPYNPDTDGDEMPDGFEVLRGLHPQDPVPNNNGTRTLRLEVVSRNGDPDVDGVGNLREYNIRFLYSTNEALTAATDLSTFPWDWDSDDDGLGDGEEDRMMRTHALLQDTDGDGLADGSGVPDTPGEMHSYHAYQAEFGRVQNAGPHYDLAANDLWMLYWPEQSGGAGTDTETLPEWIRVEPNPDSPIPEARWGQTATFVPAVEVNAPSDGPLEIVLDNRSVLVLGGRDGVDKYQDIWQWWVGENRWQKLYTEEELDPGVIVTDENLLDSAYGRSVEGLSEMTALPILGFQDTRGSQDCPSRASNQTFEWSYLLGGWDNYYNYYGVEMPSFFKSSDSGRGTVSTFVNDVDVFQDTDPDEPVKDNFSRNGIDTIPIGAHPDWLAAAFHWTFDDEDLNFSEACQTLNEAIVTFDVHEGPEKDVEIELQLEINLAQGESPAEYDVATGTDPVTRLTDEAFFRSSVVTATIPAGVIDPAPIVVDVTDQFLEVITSGVYSGATVGVLITSTNSVDPETEVAYFLDDEHARLQISFIPNWRVLPGGPTLQPFWTASTVLVDGATQGQTVRKSSQVAYHYGSDAYALVFGGIQHNDVKGDTFEIRYTFNAAFNPIGTVWRFIETEVAPEPRYAHSLVYDQARQVFVLFGGFNAEHEPLNDLWEYSVGGHTWTEVTVFQDEQRPMPRGGASMVYFGGAQFRGDGVWNSHNEIVMFGGTDGDVHFNDTWVYDPVHVSDIGLLPSPGPRWKLAIPNGEYSTGPSPRAFSSMVYAHNSELNPFDGYIFTNLVNGAFTQVITNGDPNVVSRFVDGNNPANAAAFLFGGRLGTLPTGRDTDDDKVDDGLEYQLGGTDAGRDPRENALHDLGKTNLVETIPYAYKRIGAPPKRSAIADFESLVYDDNPAAGVQGMIGVPAQGHPIQVGTNGPSPFIGNVPVSPEGYDAWIPQYTNQWWHRFGGDDPGDERDEWELGMPDDFLLGPIASPPYAYRGRWVYATDLDDSYPNDAVMELYSPAMDLRLPIIDSTNPDVVIETPFYLMFHEWLDLADSSDRVRIDVIRPQTPAEVLTRATTNTPVLVLGDRNNTYNTDGEWRRQVVPLDILGGETNIYFRFTLRSDEQGVAGGWYIDDVAVYQAARLSGTVTDDSGEPLADQEVTLVGANSNQTTIDSTLTDSLGRYQFGPLPFGDYVIKTGDSVIPVTVSAPENDRTVDTTPSGLVISEFSMVAPATITWVSVPEFTYAVEYADGLEPFMTWELLDVVTAEGTTTSYVDESPAVSTRVYRIVLQP